MKNQPALTIPLEIMCPDDKHRKVTEMTISLLLLSSHAPRPSNRAMAEASSCDDESKARISPLPRGNENDTASIEGEIASV